MTFFAFTFCFWAACDPGTRGGCLFRLVRNQNKVFQVRCFGCAVSLQELQWLLGCLQMHDAPGPRDQGKWP